MGGNAFAALSPAIHPVRLTPAKYASLVDHYAVKLRSLYARVGSPVAALEKESHGDIDIMVCGLKDTQQGNADEQSRRDGEGSDSDPEGAMKADIGLHIGKLDKLIQSTAHVYLRGAPIVSFAIPLHHPPANPPSLPPPPPRPPPEGTGSAVDDPTEYFQLDATLVPSHPAELFDWNLLLNSYGDLWSIMGIFLRPLGLVALPAGLFLVSASLEASGKRRGRLLLTRDVDRALGFVGLPRLRFAAQTEPLVIGPGKKKNTAGDGRHTVDSVDELFDLICRSKFFSPEPFSRFDRETLRSSDKKRLERPTFRRFVREHVPRLVALRNSEARNLKRKRVVTPNEATDANNNNTNTTDNTIDNTNTTFAEINTNTTAATTAYSHPLSTENKENEPEQDADGAKEGNDDNSQATNNTQSSIASSVGSTASAASSSATATRHQLPPPAASSPSVPVLSRANVAEEALAAFGKHAEWDAMHKPRLPASSAVGGAVAKGHGGAMLPPAKLDFHWAKGVRKEEADRWAGYTRAWLEYLGVVEEKGGEVRRYRYPWAKGKEKETAGKEGSVGTACDKGKEKGRSKR